MAFRSLTEVFILMRNNALQSRHIYSEQVLDDRVALVSHQDVEKGITPIKDSRVPPAWVDSVEEVQYEMTKIRHKMKEIAILYDKRMNRPTLDDSTADDREIEIYTQDITRMFMHCQRLVHQIRSKSQGSSVQDSRVNKNVVTCLVTSLQELSSTFRSAQSSYLKRLKSQEERSQEFFDTPLLVGTNDSSSFQDNYAEKMFDQQFIKEQQLLLEDNTQLVEQREREINRIVCSIAELNEIFKDLASIVVDQGTILDRIDYNLEQVQTRVHEGLHQLQKAENYQRKNHKMMCILILASVTVLLIILLIALKT